MCIRDRYVRYGGWKAELVRLHPRPTNLRHLVAPLFVASILVLGIAGIFWKPAWWLLLLELVVYVGCALLAGWQAARRAGAGLQMALVMPLIFPTIPLSWGSRSLVRLLALGSGQYRER